MAIVAEDALGSDLRARASWGIVAPVGRKRRKTWWRSPGKLLLLLALLYGAHEAGVLGRIVARLAEVAADRLAAGSDDDYDRKTWAHWVDDDHDCQDTRDEVLVIESTTRVRFRSGKACDVRHGRWRCPFTGRVIEDPRDLDIDHLVPLHEAHRSGGHAWSRAQRRRYANALRDPDHLVAVDKTANRRKGDKDPASWLPPDPAYRCHYLRAWVRIKKQWKLDMDRQERNAVTRGLELCARGKVPPLPARR